MAILSHGPGTPLFITPDFSHVRPPLVEAPHAAFPGLYALITVLVVVVLAAAIATTWWSARRRGNDLVAQTTPVSHPRRNLHLAPKA